MTDDFVKHWNDLSETGLRTAIVDRLHRLEACGPPIDPRGDIRPHEWIADYFLKTGESRQRLLSLLLAKLLEEVEEKRHWPETARLELLDLLQTTGDTVVTEAVLALLRRNRDSDPIRPAQLLKLLLARGYRATPEFWLQWLERLGADYGGLILGGLASHGPETVGESLPKLVVSPLAQRALRLFLPELEQRWGRDSLKAMIKTVWPRLSAEARTLFSQRFPDLSDITPWLKTLWAAPDQSHLTMARGWGLTDDRRGYAGISEMIVPGANRPNPRLLPEARGV